jgi:hypothetical protein
MPANPRTDFVFIQDRFLFRLFEALLDRPTTSGDAADQPPQITLGMGTQISTRTPRTNYPRRRVNFLNPTGNFLIRRHPCPP